MSQLHCQVKKVVVLNLKKMPKKPWKQLRVTLSGALVASIGALIVLWGCKIVN